MAAQVITQEEFEPIVAMIRELHREIQILKKLARKDVDTEEAMEIIRLSRRGLENERARPGTLIKFGKKGRKVVYDHQSLLDYNESKQLSTPSISHLRIAL
ncbi:hypothetical protein [Rufibacter soli]